MYRYSFVACFALAFMLCGSAVLMAQNAPKAYPIKLEKDDVRALDELAIETNGLRLTAKDGD